MSGERVTVEADSKGIKTRTKQSDVPAYSLAQAIKVAQAISDQFGKQPTKPLHVASALNIKPQSSHFRVLTGAAIAFGLTDGAYNAELISLTSLGRRIVAPTVDGDDQAAKREAFLKPRIIREFTEKYNGSKLPSDRIALNVIEEMGVGADKTQKVLELIKEGLTELGLIQTIKGELYVDVNQPISNEQVEEVENDDAETDPNNEETDDSSREEKVAATSPQNLAVNKKVFISHGKNKDISSQLKELLIFGKFDPVISIERETTAKPVPDKVLDDMRTCAAAIIHVGTERKLMDQEGNEISVLNQNVLIEIGAAMALYGRKFILLVEDGVVLPSNLQGLYEVRYQGDKLDYDATMKLLKAFNSFSN